MLFCLALVQVVLANKAKFDDKLVPQVCAGMYSKHDWGGAYRPHIGILVTDYAGEHYKPGDEVSTTPFSLPISYVIFEIKDLKNIGYELDNGQMKYICDDYAIKTLKACNETQKGKFIINEKYPTNTTILTSQLTHLGQAHINYTIAKTGYYCVSTFIASDKKYKGVINFQNAFGFLSASEIPKLPAYGILCICYLVVLALYGFQFFKKRNKNQILPLQRYLLAMLGLLTFDTLVVWSYYDLVNRTSNPSSKFVTAYMIFLSILNSTKITFSFFLLLCISLGYGVVVLKLKKSVMLKCKILAGVHFLACCCYLISTYLTGSSTATSSAEPKHSNFGSLLFLLPMIPITITLTVYYLAVLISIKQTTAKLHAQRQIIKLKLYENLFRIIFGSVVITMFGLAFSSIVYMSMSSGQSIEQYWKAAYFLYEFWPSIIFFIVFMGVGWLWRPTETSYMLAISQQLSNQGGDEEEDLEGNGYHQHGTEFELDDLSLLSHSDTENEPRRDVDLDDSFELEREPTASTAAAPVPPSYEELDSKKTKKSEDEEGDDGNTLFELGEESDGEEDGHSKHDDRLN